MEKYTLELTVDEINFIGDAIDSYYYTIGRLFDDKSVIDNIMQNIFGQFPKPDSFNSDVIIDVEPEIISEEEVVDETEDVTDEA